MLRATREFFARRGVMEVQTPVLGAATVTDPAIDSLRAGTPNAPGPYLQTSPEFHMKRLLAAGAPSIYQIGPVFRAGEQGRWHNPEFTMLEW
ncbi:MAG: EF-P lysine aminoacylase GenX, partial [Gammaproteobacteria bacterium]|nr:EF-P lysine aminoacylase GenX [Gammaproteobacteria bacterium]